MKLSKVGLGISLGIVGGLAVFVATIWIAASGKGGEHLRLLNRFYIGYTVSYLGAVIGLIYGFIDGFIGGFLIALFYNIFAKK
ncbi:MAG: hypothetical protein J7L64_08790 [Acidobacteria bacterium]|nr:hypothetical protein [Acidobacteriota bacterium]